MNPRNAIITTALVLGLVLASASAYAGPGFGRGGCGPCGGYGNAQALQNLTPEKQAQFDTLFKEYRTTTRALHNDFWAANLELKVLANNPKAEPDRIRQLIDTMKNLRAKMDAARDTFDQRVEKEVGITPGPGFGMGFGRGASVPAAVLAAVPATDPARADAASAPVAAKETGPARDTARDTARVTVRVPARVTAPARARARVPGAARAGMRGPRTPPGNPSPRTSILPPKQAHA